VEEGLQYMPLGGGEGRQLIPGAAPAKLIVAAREWDVFARTCLAGGRGQCANKTEEPKPARSNVDDMPRANTVNSNRSILVFIGATSHRWLSYVVSAWAGSICSGQADRRDFSCR